MGKLLKKELMLSLHPTTPIFLCLSLMLIIPNYPYYIVFFYTALAVFFICVTGRENHDVFFTMLLPVRKKDIVKSRFTLVVLLEILQMFLAVPFAFIRQNMPVSPNEASIEANIALFGIGFIMYGFFNIAFFGGYYKNVQKVGKSFVVAVIIMACIMVVTEVLVHGVPYFRDCIDTYDNVYVADKLVILGVGICVYIVLTIVSYIRAVKMFEMQDIMV